MTKSTITRERLEWLSQISCRDDIEDIGGDEIRELASMALAAMDGEPVAWTWHYREQWHVTNDKCRAEFVATDGDVAVLPLYRHAQPAQEYPEVLPCPVLLEPGMRFGKGVKIRLVLEAIQRRAEHCAELEAMTPDGRAEYDANIEAFKAMLPQPAPLVPDGYVMVPKDVSPEQLRAFQLNTKIGAYVTANWSDAYDSLRELWDVAIAHCPKIKTMD
ncbi:TPA: hypothetical protein MFL88_004148 [Klebsiella pneumoniae]|nr:hypothetical protein [Klebsiella pneumoniae]HBW8288090.1 hypothetical protein [Klebsiella pneumoniae]HBW8293582.1 hypothetical protein [Klebsiella pneumoniae]HBW8299166.1 hypothetical protein [Klebsiella pneumoniae]HBW8304774.1 hypothetical protein [Klebsiella pneumoniae]